MSEYQHNQTAHCENGVTVSLLKNKGVKFISEPLAFGIGSGLFYIHIPFLKINNGPAISFRTMPGNIFKRTCRALKVKVNSKKFSSEIEAKKYLDKCLEQGVHVGCQVGVFHLMYFPAEYRFHFNAHNLIVFGKHGDEYSISDPVMENTTTLTSEELSRVRFAKGAFAPKGHLYYPGDVPEISDETLRKAIIKGIKFNSRAMLHIPGNAAGVKGIKYTAKKIRGWKTKLGERQAKLNLGQIVRMQEEIGTGGGGFRFLYAAFLEEVAEILNKPELLPLSEKMTQSGDLWRDSALLMSGIYKGRLTSQKDYNDCADLLDRISDIERSVFTQLKKMKF